MPTTRSPVAGEGDVLGLLEAPPQRFGGAPVVEAVGGEVGLRPGPVDALEGAVDPHRHRPQHPTASGVATGFSLSPGSLAPLGRGTNTL